MWPDWAIYWTLYSFLKLLATINLPKSATFLGNFCKGVKIFHFSSEINFGQLFKTFGNFFWSHCEWVFTDLRYFIQYFFSICRSRDLHTNTSTHTTNEHKFDWFLFIQSSTADRKALWYDQPKAWTTPANQYLFSTQRSSFLAAR